jgi:hypothetical protein
MFDAAGTAFNCMHPAAYHMLFYMHVNQLCCAAVKLQHLCLLQTAGPAVSAAAAAAADIRTQLPKFALSMPRSGASSPTAAPAAAAAKRSDSRSSSRARSTSSSPVPRNPTRAVATNDTAAGSPKSNSLAAYSNVQAAGTTVAGQLAGKFAGTATNSVEVYGDCTIHEHVAEGKVGLAESAGKQQGNVAGRLGLSVLGMPQQRP